MHAFRPTPRCLRVQVVTGVLALAVAGLVLGGCGREQAPAADGAAASDGSATGALLGRPSAAPAATPAKPSAAPDIEFIAHGFRLEGSLFGAAALEQRFAGDPPDWGGVLAEGEALQRFLAASRPVVLCQSADEAVVAYHGPLFGALLLTRWTLGRPIRLATVQVVVPAEEPADGAHGGWLEVLANASGANPAQAAFAEVAAQRARAAGRSVACGDAGPKGELKGELKGGQSPNRGQSHFQSPFLVTPRERGQSLFEVFDSGRGVGDLHRGMLALFHRGDLEPLTRLFGAEALAPLAGVPAARPRLQLMPVYRWSAAAAGPAERHLLVYADLLEPGRYVLVTAVLPTGLGAPPGPTAAAPGVHAEFRATLVRL